MRSRLIEGRGDNTVEAKKKAVERLQKMQPGKFRYNVVYTTATSIGVEELQPVLDWIRQ